LGGKPAVAVVIFIGDTGLPETESAALAGTAAKPRTEQSKPLMRAAGLNLSWDFE
jgi:hypothetical protein